jgi:hypothetical protein
MSNFVYRYRTVAALLGAVAMGVLAIAVMPVAAGNLGRTIAAAGTPHCSGSQNPFVGSSF